MNDEDLYLEATREVEGEDKSAALWAKVMALSEGDQHKAKYRYIKLRVEQLKKSKDEKRPIFTKKAVDDFTLRYMPISEFSRIKSIPEKKIVEMIRDGFYVGQIKDNEWYVSRDEVGKSDVLKKTVSPSKATTHLRQEFIPVEEFAEYKAITTEKVIEMIRDGFYQGQIIDDKWYVAYSEVESAENTIQPGEGSVLEKMVNGDFGLPKTYWLFGVLGGVLFIIPATLAAMAESFGALVLVILASVIYQVFVAVGIWRASDKYRGPKVWAVLAKIVVIIGILRLLVELMPLRII